MGESGNSSEIDLQNCQVIVENVVYNLNPEHFRIDDTILDIELCKIGSSLLEYGSLEAISRTELGRKEAEIERIAALVDAAIRADAAASGEKLTENRIKAQVLLNQNYIAALKEKEKIQTSCQTLRWAMVSLQKKCDCLITLGYRERSLIKSDAY